MWRTTDAPHHSWDYVDYLLSIDRGRYDIHFTRQDALGNELGVSVYDRRAKETYALGDVATNRHNAVLVTIATSDLPGLPNSFKWAGAVLAIPNAAAGNDVTSECPKGGGQIQFPQR